MRTSSLNPRKFIMILGLFLFLIGASPFIEKMAIKVGIITPSILLVFTSLFSPRLSSALFNLWMKFGHTLGRINTFIILFLVYYFILFPVSLAAKVFSKNSEKFSFQKSLETCWKKKSVVEFKEDMKRPF